MIAGEMLDEILGSRARIGVLRTLGRATEPLTGREIARRAALSHTAVHEALSHLWKFGVLDLAPGRRGSSRYSVRSSHALIAEILSPMFRFEETLLERLSAAVALQCPPGSSVIVFGSAARGEDGPDSDVDLLALVPSGSDLRALEERMDTLDTWRTLGRRVFVLVWTPEMMRRAKREGSPILSEIEREGRALVGTLPWVDRRDAV